MRRHSAFPALVASLRTRIAQELQLSGHLLVLSAVQSYVELRKFNIVSVVPSSCAGSTSIKVVFYCKSGRHRSVAFGTMFKYILLYEDFRNLQNNQLFCLRGHWMHALGA